MSKDFMYVESNKTKKPSKRFLQKSLNTFVAQATTELEGSIRSYFNAQGLLLTSAQLFHNSHQLKKCIKLKGYKEHANGITFVIYKFENHRPLYDFIVCVKGDTFSRLDGRYHLYRQTYNKLLTKGIEGLYTYDTKEGFENSIDGFKVGNSIIKKFILPEKEVKVLPINMLKYQHEDKLLDMAKEVLAHKYQLDLSSCKLTTQHLRFYSTKLFSHGLVCTPEWFKDLDQEGKELNSYGGYTVYAIKGVHKETKEDFVAVTFAICSKEDTFVKEYGRKQCLMNFIKDKVDVYPMRQEVPNMKDALVALAENSLQHAINVKVETEKTNTLVS